MIVKESDQSDSQRIEEQLNFFEKPSAEEFYKKVQKEQEQMEGYLPEAFDDFDSSQSCKNIKMSRRNKTNPITKLKMETTYNRNYQSEMSHLESDAYQSEREEKKEGGSLTNNQSKRRKHQTKQKYSKVPKSFNFVNKLINNRLKKMRRRFKVSENEEQCTDSLIS
mmetsp:Transcript_23702/g.21064  ORF Transcript_23702/g.21064 Transcript_23702/m.21064 type:complete len:166 (+) Transcript_23702:141-638(+)